MKKMFAFSLAFALPSLAFAEEPTADQVAELEALAPSSEKKLASTPDSSEVDQLIDSISIKETKLNIVPKANAMKSAPPSDTPNTLSLPLLEPNHRSRGKAYLDPFLGRVIYPELAVRMTTTFARELNNGTQTQKGPTALLARADISLWALDLRFAFANLGPDTRQPFDLVLKVPFSAGDHWFAPILAFHFPLDVGPSEAIYEAGLGYHGRFGPVGLKLEVTGFNGGPQRTKAVYSRGMIGFDAALSVLASDGIGIVIEAEGTTVASEVEGTGGPKIGDTVVHLVPGLRFFPKGEGFELGIAGIITVASSDYEVLERHGAMVSAGYTFF